MNKFKSFSLIIALKRKKRNSKILKKAKYKLAADYNLHPTTFCKLLEQCVSEEWITLEGDYYHIKKFSEIVKDFREKTGLRFHFHQILGENTTHRHQNFDVKSITDELYGKLLLDNVMAPQEYMIRLKEGLSSRNIQTVKSSIRKLQKIGVYTCADDVEKNIQHQVVSSDRHVSSKLEITRYRASKILNGCKDISREVKSVFYHTRNVIFDYERLRLDFPRATVIPMPAISKIKVCHGSVLSRVNKQ